MVMLVMHQSTSEGEQSSFHPANLEETDGRLDKNVTKAMNILLFYADDWRHDSSSVAKNLLFGLRPLISLLMRESDSHTTVLPQVFVG